MENRLDQMILTKDTMSPQALRTHLEKWDSDQGRAMFNAEALLRRPRNHMNGLLNFETPGCCTDTGDFDSGKKYTPKTTTPHSNAWKAKLSNMTRRSFSLFLVFISHYLKFKVNSRSQKHPLNLHKRRHSNSGTDAILTFLQPTRRTRDHPQDGNQCAEQGFSPT
jgi:hypothetical protein